MDEFLPKAILDGVQSILILVGSIVITAMVNPYFLIPFAILGVIFVYIRKIYLMTSKNIKRIEGIGELFEYDLLKILINKIHYFTLLQLNLLHSHIWRLL